MHQFPQRGLAETLARTRGKGFLGGFLKRSRRVALAVFSQSVALADQLFFLSHVEAPIVARTSHVECRSSHQPHLARRSVDC